MEEQLIKWKEVLWENTETPTPIQKALLIYVEELLKNDVPVIFESEHLAKLIGLKHTTINKIVQASSKFYITFKIPKRQGGERTIQAPYPSLLLAQNWIKTNVLERVAVHENAYGFIQNRSIIDNARQHLDKTCLLRLDLIDFFPSIKINRVIHLFKSLGYTHKLSLYLATICTLNNQLPQGAPTSPIISNIVCRRLDKRLFFLAQKNNFTYTRYADDMVFSGEYINQKFIDIVRKIIVDEGFLENETKTVLIRGNDKKKIVTGVSVASETLKLPKETKRKWRKEAYFLIKNGLRKQLEYIGINDPVYLERIIGKLNFWKQIEPDNQFVIESLDKLKKMSNK